MKPKRAHTFFGLLKNDLEFVDAQVLRQKIYDQSRFSILYFILLIGSTLVCTLGLLTDNSAIVIGGMLIAPLMWPLARVGYGISHNSPQHLYRGMILLFASILIGAVSAYLITSISPIKVINSEILARTSPTLMDLFIALTAGFVAAIAITQKKIADSLAGVAIAVSLMPPLCTVGIALSLRNVDYGLGALLLFAVNAACITLVTTFVLAYNNYVRTKRLKVATRAISINILLILLMAIPLISFLRTYSFEVKSYSTISNQMQEYIEAKNAGATFENIEITRADSSTMAVGADLLLPNDSVFSFTDNEELVALLEREVDKKILLNIRIQTIIEPITKDQTDNEAKIKSISDQLVAELAKKDESYIVSSVNVSLKSDQSAWLVTAEVLSDPEIVPTDQTLTTIDDSISAITGENIDLNLTFVPRLTLRSNEQTISQEVRKSVETATAQVDTRAEVSNFTLKLNSGSISVTYTLTANNIDLFDADYLSQVKDRIKDKNNENSSLRVRLVEATDISL